MRSTTQGSPNRGISGGTPSEPLLIDFGVDDNLPSEPLSMASSELDQPVDPFGWIDGLHTSVTRLDPFEGPSFVATPSEDSLRPMPPPPVVNLVSAGNAVTLQAASKPIQVQNSAVGIDLLTGSTDHIAQPLSGPVDPFELSPGIETSWIGSRSLDPGSAARVPASSVSRQPIANTSVPARWETPFLESQSPITVNKQEFSEIKDSSPSNFHASPEPATLGSEISAIDWTLVSQLEKESSALEHYPTTSSPATYGISRATVYKTKVGNLGPQDQQETVLSRRMEQMKIAETRQSTEYSTSSGVELFNSETNPSTSRASLKPSSTTVPKQQSEFLASGAGKGVYRVPSREFITAGRPVPLELRPHPYKDMSQSIKQILCTKTSLWAAFDYGLNVWDLQTATSSTNAGADNLLGDEDAAPYSVLAVSEAPTLCLALDLANQIVWSGHKDGNVRAWPLQVHSGELGKRNPTLPTLVWKGHETPVTAITVTSYGEMWTGSESGSMKAWPCEVVFGGLKSAAGGDYAAVASWAKLAVPLRAPIQGNNPTQTEVRILLTEHSCGRVWAGGIFHISLWDARTREMIRVFWASSEAALLSQEFSQAVELSMEERIWKKEKSVGWLQRSRNAFMGAADAVRRAADRSGHGAEEAKRLEALVMSPDGTVWGGLGNGLLVQWDSGGNRLKELLSIPVAVKCLLAVGTRLWAGYANGRVEVRASRSGRSQGSWGAHSRPLVQMARGGDYVFTLASNGGIRGWHVASLSPFDSLLQMKVSKRADFFTQQRNFRVLAATWNVSQEKASIESIRMWLAGSAAGASMVFVGLQEMEVGAGALGLAAVKETVGVGLQDKGSANSQWWLESIGTAIGKGNEFERLASRQLAGLLIGVWKLRKAGLLSNVVHLQSMLSALLDNARSSYYWVRRKIRPFVGDVDAAAVACGFGRTLGNKGAVGVKMSVFRRTVCVVNSHFAAHMEKVASRNADFEYVYKQMAFGQRPNYAAGAAAGVSSAMQYILRGNKISLNSDYQDSFEDGDIALSTEQELMAEAVMPDLSEADVLVWFGDLNYRLDTSYDQAMEWIQEKCYDKLLSKDQLRNEMISGRTFPGMREGVIEFLPTYKFDRGYQAYDTSEKKRVPAYCDRVIFRDSFGSNDAAHSSRLLRPAKVTAARYEACMEVSDSDHKPVLCLLDVDLAVIDEAARRHQHGNIIQKDPQVLEFLEQCNVTPKTRVNTKKIMLEENLSSKLQITNESQRSWATFTVHCEGVWSDDCPCRSQSNQNLTSSGQFSRGGFGFPQWLQVQPAAGMIGPTETTAISIQYSAPPPTLDANFEFSKRQPSWWGDFQKNKCLVLVLSVRGPLVTSLHQHLLCISRTPASESQGQAQRRQRTTD